MRDAILDFFFPQRCVTTQQEWLYLSKQAKKWLIAHPEMCPASHRFSRDFLTLPWYQKEFCLKWIHIWFYYDTALKKLILKLKYYHQKDVIDTLVDRLIISMQTNKTLRKDIQRWNICLTYVPSHRWRKYITKGYNQSELLANKISERLLIPCVSVAKKTKYTRSQTKLSRKQRLHNVSGSFQLHNQDSREPYKKIIIVDDIVTTWSTINTIARLIKTTYPQKVVWWLVIGRHNG